MASQVVLVDHVVIVNIHSFVVQLMIFDCSDVVFGLYILITGLVVSKIMVHDVIEILPPASRNLIKSVFVQSVVSRIRDLEDINPVQLVTVVDVQ